MKYAAAADRKGSTRQASSFTRGREGVKRRRRKSGTNPGRLCEYFLLKWKRESGGGKSNIGSFFFSKVRKRKPQRPLFCPFTVALHNFHGEKRGAEKKIKKAHLFSDFSLFCWEMGADKRGRGRAGSSICGEGGGGWGFNGDHGGYYAQYGRLPSHRSSEATAGVACVVGHATLVTEAWQTLSIRRRDTCAYKSTLLRLAFRLEEQML